jgi:hypothetical protein
VARIDCARAQLTYAGVGNVEALLWQTATHVRPIAYRGIVGVAMPTVRAFDLALQSEWILLLHTDGVSSRVDLQALSALDQAGSQVLANHVLHRWGRQTDDATVVVVRPSPSAKTT